MIRRVLDAILPAAVIIAEVEIWPNFLDVLRRRNIPTYLVDGRIGARELAGYRRLRWFFRPFYAMYRRVLAQSEGDRARTIEIGMPERLAWSSGAGPIVYNEPCLQRLGPASDGVRDLFYAIEALLQRRGGVR